MSDTKENLAPVASLGLPLPREGGVELLRCVLMLFIIGHHVMVHGIGLYDGSNMQFDSWIKLALNSIFVVAVDAFVLISGYYSIKLKTNALVKLSSQALFYSIVLGILFMILGRVKFAEASVLAMLLPISNNVWWFISTYVFLMLLSPLLNHLINGLNKKHFTMLLIGFLLLEIGMGFYYATATIWGFNGYSLFNFITLYLLGAWLKRYHLVKSRWVYALLWLLSTAAMFTIAAFSIQTQDWSRVFNRAFAYNSPLLYFSAIALFFFFKSLTIKARLVFFCAPLVLGVYLIHDHPYVRSVIYKTVLQLDQINQANPIHALALMPVVIVGIFFACIAIESLRARCMKPLETWLALRPFFKALDAVLLALHVKKA